MERHDADGRRVGAGGAPAHRLLRVGQEHAVSRRLARSIRTLSASFMPLTALPLASESFVCEYRHFAVSPRAGAARGFPGPLFLVGRRHHQDLLDGGGADRLAAPSSRSVRMPRAMAAALRLFESVFLSASWRISLSINSSS